MSVPPSTGTFTIKSVAQGLAPVGATPDPTLPYPPPPGFVLINGEYTTWNIVQQGGFNVFQFAIGGYDYTGATVTGGGPRSVIATTDVTQNLTWFARYFESQNAYTIETNNNPGFAWTVAAESVPNPPIVITPVAISNSDSTQFSPTNDQLFRFYNVSA